MKIILITLLTIALISCNVSDSSVAMDNTSNDIVNTHNVVNTQEHKSNPNSESDKNTSDGSNKSKALTDSQKNTNADDLQSDSSKTLPDISYFATNKSDRFIVDFEDIVAAHPYVGARSPRPHNDAQIYFSNTDERWINATKPSDYPPIYAVSNGYINMPEMGFYNVVDHSDASSPWWHVAYVFTLKIAQSDGGFIDFLYQMEPYMIPELTGKPKDFYKQFILVEDGQFVKKGDILGYMYVPLLDEMVGSQSASSHIAFSLIKQPRTIYVPAIFSEEIVEEFAEIYRNPTEGWGSKSFGADWNRGRGLPDAMGWMVSGEENPFNDNNLDVLIYDGVLDQNLDSNAMVYPEELGFSSKNILYSAHGWGDSFKDIVIEEDWQLLFSGIGGPMKFTILIDENDSIRESQVFELRPGQNFSLYHTDNFLGNASKFSVSISDPDEWGWSFAFAKKESEFIEPGTLRDVSPLCPPGCPPSPNPYKLKK